MIPLWQQRRVLCSFCRSPTHVSSRCIRFTRISSYRRREIARKLKLCIICLEHKEDKECQSKKMCGICKRAHHTLLHPYKNTAEFKGNAEEKEESRLKSKAEIDRELLKFWEVEGAQGKTTIQDHACEEHFTQSHARNKEGKYIVHLPFKDDPEKLGDSKEQALAKLERLEKEFAVNDQLYYDYKDFIDENIASGHISLAEDTDGPKYYLPHHAVCNSSTKETEIVFEASSKTTTGLSLNSILNKGLKIHEDLRSILTRWRKHHYVFTAKVEEIVKQILIEPAERNFLRILWREDPREPIKEYTLNTVTKGLTPATYLSFRTLMQLALDDRDYCPRAAAAMNDFHVDQLISGGASKDRTMELQVQFYELISRADMALVDWTGNRVGLLGQRGKLNRREVEAQYVEFGDEGLKTLGFGWSSLEDSFKYKVKQPTISTIGKITKRTIFSDIVSLFDPMGLVAPVIMKAKLIMHWLQMDKVAWDEPVPRYIYKEWSNFAENLPALEKLLIKRHLVYEKGARVQLHAFAYTSGKTYGAVVYARVTHKERIQIMLLGAKTRIAPTRKELSIERLGLCSAVMAAELLQSISDSLQIPTFIKNFVWLGSHAALAWIAKRSSKWEDFVAERVAKIHKLKYTEWNFVDYEENPARIATVGLCPSKLKSNNLWWCGPHWLPRHESWWPNAVDEQLKMFEEARAQQFRGTSECLVTFDQLGISGLLEAVSDEEKIHLEKSPPCELLAKYNSFSRSSK